MIEHIDAAREQQSLERHVSNLLGMPSTAERRAYITELQRHYEAGFVERVKAEFVERRGKR